VKIALISVLAVVIAVAGGLTYMWFDLNGKLTQTPIGNLLDSSRPPELAPSATVMTPGDPFAGRAMNILVLGTDSREGANSSLTGDDVAGMRSDTTFIAHVSADRTRIDIVSIPRDTFITIPDCKADDGSVIPEAGWMNMGFNAAFAYGVSDGGSLAAGAACAIRAVEAMSNVHIDAYVVVDFMGFVKVVDSIGGVDVTLLCPINSPNADHLSLPAGVNHLDGKTAVELARAREGLGLGDGSDLQRIRRQHALFEAIAAKVYDMNYVTDFPKLYNLVSAAISSVTTDIGNLADVAGFAYSLKDFNTANLNSVMIPIADAGDGAHVVLVPSQDEPIWEALRNDTPLPIKSDQAPTSSPSASASPSVGATSSASGAPTATASVQPPPTIQDASDCD